MTQRWEYKVIEINPTADVRQIEHGLNRWGENEWELVIGVPVRLHAKALLIFKRPKSDVPAIPMVVGAKSI